MSSYGQGVDSGWLQSMLAQNQAAQLSPEQLFRPGAFQNMSSNLERSRHFSPAEVISSPSSSVYGVYDPTIQAMTHAYHAAANNTGLAEDVSIGMDGSFIGPLDENLAFSSSNIKSMLVCGPPGAGKTETIKNILFRLSPQMDCLIFVTKTQETVFWAEHTMPYQYIQVQPDPEVMMPLLELFEQYYAQNQRKGICCVVVDDVLVSRADRGTNSRLWLDEYILRGHRAGMLLIVGCHKASNIWGGASADIPIKMQCGSVENYPQDIREFWELCCKTRFPYWQDFLNVYNTAVQDRGQCFVLQNINGPAAVSYWRPPMLTEPIVFGHRDWWISTHMWTDPVRNFIVTVDENGNEEHRWPPYVSGLRSGPSMELLKKQQAGIDVDKELSKLISIEPPPPAGAKKGRAKRTSALR